MKISELGLIGNCRTAALVSITGDITWCCLPRFDSPSVFASLLDEEKGGNFSLRPAENFTSEQNYLHDSNILETIFSHQTGAARLLDGFTVMDEKEKRNQLSPHHELIRIIEGLEGEMKFRLHFEPRMYYGQKKAPLKIKKNGLIKCDLGDASLYLVNSLPIPNLEHTENTERSYISAEFTVKAGERFAFSFVYSDIAPDVIPCVSEASFRLENSIRFWRNWISRCNYHGPYADHVKRSAFTLKLLAFAPSGAIVAAPSTSLPESIHGSRNWDYRYCWLRDAAFTVRSFVAIGFEEEAKAYVNWLLHSTNLTQPRLQVLYNLFGEAKVPEKVLPWLKGFADSRPVRIGNGADTQFQLDVYGEVLNAIYYYAPATKYFDRETKKFIIGMGDIVLKLWQIPDEGIWEVRSLALHHTHSKVMAWVALDRVMKLAKLYDWKIDFQKYQKGADEIRTKIEKEGFDPELGAYTHAFGSNSLDASVLVMPLVDYCPADSPRMESTCKVIQDKLSVRGLVYRYRSLNDGLEGEEGTFSLCNFWMVQNLAQAGRLSEAKAWFENLLSRQNHLGLWSEEIEPYTGEFLGNYPQAFSHTGLINAALTLSEQMEKRKSA
jgi:GH15 family glucan-1,4-alpha-glucosidase